ERQRFDCQRLALHRDVAVRVGSGAANDADMDRDSLVEEIFLSADGDQLDQVLGRFLVQLASAETRIGEGAEPDARQMSRLAGGDVAKEGGEGAQRRGVRFNLIANHKPLDRGDEVEMPTNDAPDEARFT